MAIWAILGFPYLAVREVTRERLSPDFSQFSTNFQQIGTTKVRKPLSGRNYQKQPNFLNMSWISG